MTSTTDAVVRCAICGKDCPKERCITDSKGRTVHKECYREALIEGRESL